MEISDILSQIARGSLRSYTWVAEQLGYQGAAARAAGQAIARETLSRWCNPEIESQAMDAEAFPWWRVVGLHGDVQTIHESEDWYIRTIERLAADGHNLVQSPDTEGLRVQPLPVDFE